MYAAKVVCDQYVSDTRDPASRISLSNCPLTWAAAHRGRAVHVSRVSPVKAARPNLLGCHLAQMKLGYALDEFARALAINGQSLFNQQTGQSVD